MIKTINLVGKKGKTSYNYHDNRTKKYIKLKKHISNQKIRKEKYERNEQKIKH